MLELIGFYDYTVVLTFVSLILSVVGIFLAVRGECVLAALCLSLSGGCDAFDGRIARTKKDRTEDEKAFGIQLDSLCDMVCFGVFPAVLCHQLGVRSLLGVAVLAVYCLCAMIRLAYFNVLEANRQKTAQSGNSCYRGLPVTSIAVLLPLLVCFRQYVPAAVFEWGLTGVMALVGFLFVLDFPVRKPGVKTILIIMGIMAVTAALTLLVFGR